MSVTHPVYFLLVLAVALASVWLVDKRFPLALGTDRVAGIDGLRGYLAAGVFVHHACIWYFFLRSGQWAVPPSAFYTELGRTSVGLFFMITGFLFMDRILRARAGGIDWDRLYSGRLLRIFPLLIVHHLAAVLLMAVIRAADWPTLFDGIDTDRRSLLTAAVTWTLKYEWMFYLLLPLLAALRGLRPPAMLLLLSAGVLVTHWDMVTGVTALPFLGGLLAAVLARNAALVRFCNTPVAGLLAALSLVLAYGLGPELPLAVWLGAMTVAFTLIANGNTLFGLLSCRLSRVFGEITYSVYLLHGITLFIAFRFAAGIPAAARFAPDGHWALVAAATPFLIALSFLSWRFIEQPCLRYVGAWSARLRASPSLLFPARKT